LEPASETRFEDVAKLFRGGFPLRDASLQQRFPRGVHEL
jgi:hypothetical protein